MASGLLSNPPYPCFQAHSTPAAGRALFGAPVIPPQIVGGRVDCSCRRRNARKEGRTPHTLLEADYLLWVDDETRQGALRFAEREGGPFLPAGRPESRHSLSCRDFCMPASMLQVKWTTTRICVCCWHLGHRLVELGRRHRFAIVTVGC